MEDLHEELNNKFDKPHSFCAYIYKRENINSYWKEIVFRIFIN